MDSSQKQNIITCVGRWNDNRKNAKGLVKVFLSLKTEWKINLIGNGSSRLKNQIKKMNKEITISSYEKMSHPDIFETFSKTKIFFAPSISESFNLAAAEALYSGCSIVGGSLPSFVYFANAGTNGTLSNTTDAPLLKEALEKDIKKWEQGLYEVNKISSYWQKELSPEIIIPKITEIIKSI
ncbi:MAG: glycosyltransferase [Candidatus Nomurabacteria bacterium]|nr:glycosyltransferase [Candidatus Nomurabacteria bacterium]